MTIQYRFYDASTQTAYQQNSVNAEKENSKIPHITLERNLRLTNYDNCYRAPSIEIHNLYRTMELFFKMSFKNFSIKGSDKETTTH